MNTIIIQSAVFPPIQQISWIMKAKTILVEQHDTYAKQTFRNRMQIAGPNGLQNLSIPVTKPLGAESKTKDILINYDSPWQTQFLKSIKTAYQNSAFFEYYIDAIEALLMRKDEKLIDYNITILKALLNILEINPSVKVTDKYEKTYENDFRDILHPKPQYQRADNIFKPSQYHQVFEEKYGFLPNLSIIDLIFNEGPLSYFVLINAYQR